VIVFDAQSNACSDFAADYEQLRRGVLQGTTAVSQFGLIILVREGVASWMQHASAPRVMQKRRPTTAPVVSEDSHADLVAVLTNMVLASTQENCV